MSRITLLISLVFVSSLGAQIPDGSQAPPWSATDIYGQQHSLYDYLGQGKTVFIEVSATWAAPNFNYHTSGALQALYVDYGPGGTDEVMVFMYESDASTTPADIMGNGSNTEGDWTNVPFPIINDQQVMDNYQIAYFPTVFAICPDGIITEVGQVGAAQLYQHVGTCPAIGPLNAAITDYLGSNEACPLQPYFASVVIQNQNGYDQDLNEVLIETRVNGTLHESLLWSGQLPQGESALVEIAPILTTATDFQVEVTIDYSPDEDDTDDVIVQEVSIAEAANSTILQLEIQLDHFPQETKWEIRNSAGDLVFQEGPFPGQEDETLVEFIVLPYNDCFEFKMLDAGGDGLHASASGNYSDGYFELIDEFGTELLSGGGDMEWGENGVGKTIFVDIISALEIEEELVFSVYPNPVENQLNISLKKAGQIEAVRILSLSGQQLLQFSIPAAVAELRLPLADLDSGSYLLELTQEGIVNSMLFIKTDR